MYKLRRRAATSDISYFRVKKKIALRDIRPSAFVNELSSCVGYGENFLKVENLKLRFEPTKNISVRAEPSPWYFTFDF